MRAQDAQPLAKAESLALLARFGLAGTPALLAFYGAAVFAFAGICWLPVVWLLRMARMAAEANAAEDALPHSYWRDARLWELLGYPALSAMAVVYVPMVLKPEF